MSIIFYFYDMCVNVEKKKSNLKNKDVTGSVRNLENICMNHFGPS